MVDFVEDFTKAHGEPPTYKVVADTFHIARSTVAYHLSKSKNVRESGKVAVTSVAFSEKVYRLPVSARSAVSAEYTQERERLRRVREEAGMRRQDYGRPELKLVRPESGVESAEPVEVKPESAAPAVESLSVSPRSGERAESASSPAGSLPGFLLAAIFVIGVGCAAMSR